MKPTYWDELFLDDQFELEVSKQTDSNDAAEESLERWMTGVRTGEVNYEGQMIELREWNMLDGRVLLKLPNFLIEVPKGLLMREGREMKHDQHLFMNKEEMVVFGLTLMSQELSEEAVEQYKLRMIEEWRREKPNIQFLLDETIEVSGIPLCKLDSILPYNSQLFYQILFMTSIQGHALIGSFQFKVEDASLWQPLAAAIIQSMKLNS